MYDVRRAHRSHRWGHRFESCCDHLHPGLNSRDFLYQLVSFTSMGRGAESSPGGRWRGGSGVSKGVCQVRSAPPPPGMLTATHRPATEKRSRGRRGSPAKGAVCDQRQHGVAIRVPIAEWPPFRWMQRCAPPATAEESPSADGICHSLGCQRADVYSIMSKNT